MAVLLPAKFVFLAQPHSGSSAMVLALQDVFPEAFDLRPQHMSLADVKGGPGAGRIEQINKQRTRIYKDTPRGGMTHAATVPLAVQQAITGKERVFTVIRNPYDFLVSCYVRRGGNQSFEGFVKSYNESPYIENGRIFYHVPDCQTLLRWENLQNELNELMRDLDLPEVPVGRHNVTADKKPWESYYTPKAFEIVNERFGDEFVDFYKQR